MTTKVFTATPHGFETLQVEVECDITQGLPSLQIVGLGNKAVDEARERVKSAILNSKLPFPAQRITINLAPADIPKQGVNFDLPIAIAILTASGHLKQKEVDKYLFAGELALDGSIRAIKNPIGLAEIAQSKKFQQLVIPLENYPRASLIQPLAIIGASSLTEVFLHLKGEMRIPPPRRAPLRPAPSQLARHLDDIRGQEQAKRALVIAAAGHHNLLLTGPPGSGKTMLAKSLPDLLPPLTTSEQLVVTKLHNLAGESQYLSKRPFRSLHPSASRAAFTGGGRPPRPGEISLAHLGVLFLDEIPEFSRASLEALRQPLEDRQITVSRLDDRLTYPANFMLIATRNPCPCGFYGDEKRSCSCTAAQVHNYQKKLSGPLLDRIDLQVTVDRVRHIELLPEEKPKHPQTPILQASIIRARKMQAKRYKDTSRTNSTAQVSDIKEMALSKSAQDILNQAADKLQLSPRAYFKVIKIARTIADLENNDEITLMHISEALQYRPG